MTSIWGFDVAGIIHAEETVGRRGFRVPSWALAKRAPAGRPATAAAGPQFPGVLRLRQVDPLTPRALDIVKEAARVAKAGQSAKVTCTGHTDTVGPARYNLALSLRRASAVKDALVREGVAAGSIAVVGRGEESLLVPTKEGVREPQNRRVEIVVQ